MLLRTDAADELTDDTYELAEALAPELDMDIVEEPVEVAVEEPEEPVAAAPVQPAAVG